MKSLFAKMASFLLVVCAISAHAQQTLAYTILNARSEIVDSANITYRPNGYEVSTNSRTTIFNVTPILVTIITPNFTMYMPIDGSYYHSRMGQWRRTTLSTSDGQNGYATMHYHSNTPLGRMYDQEIILGGRLLGRTRTVIDQWNQIVWSIMTDSSGGTFHLLRN